MNSELNSRKDSKIKPKPPVSRFGASVVAAVVLAGASSQVVGQQMTVRTLNPNPPPPGIVDSPLNVGNANFKTAAAMTLSVANAFDNNLGGVIDWEGANGWVANGQNLLSQTVSYGVSQSSLLTITRLEGGTQTFGPTTLGGTPTTSGTNYLGFQSASPVTFAFSKPLVDWGMTQLNRFASRTVTFSFTLADNTVVNYASQIQDSLANNTDVNNWYGFHAADSNPLVQVSFTTTGFTRFDDMAFVVVPEPAAATLLSLGLMGSAAFRRRRV